METNKEIPTVDSIFKKNTGNSISQEEYSAMIEFAKLHLSKQAEYIAEKATTLETCMECGWGDVSKQSILQASDEYIKTVK